jgi:hypothetical protein
MYVDTQRRHFASFLGCMVAACASPSLIVRCIGVKQYTHAKHNYSCRLCLRLYDRRYLQIQLLNLCGGIDIMTPPFKTMPPPGPTHGPGWHKCMPCASLTPLDGTQGVFRGSPMPQNRGNWVKIGQNRVKIDKNRSENGWGTAETLRTPNQTRSSPLAACIRPPWALVSPAKHYSRYLRGCP